MGLGWLNQHVTLFVTVSRYIGISPLFRVIEPVGESLF